MKKRMAVFFLFFLTAGILALSARAENGGVKKYGEIHNIAEDRQIEKVGGIYEPEGLDKYMQRRFDAMDARISQIQAQIGQMQAEIMRELDKIKADQKNSSVLSS